MPELFTAPALARIWEDERRRRLALVPFFAGVMTGETRALVDSFAAEPELHHPVRGRVKGVAAFERFVNETRSWLAERAAEAEDVEFVILPARGIEELVLHLDTEHGRVGLPVAVASDHDERGRIVEQRIYFSRWPLDGAHAVRPPVLQPDPGVHLPDVVGDYQRALAAGDLAGAMAAFAPDAQVREPAGGPYVHRGTDELRTLYERFFANGGGIPLEHCAVTTTAAPAPSSTTWSPGAGRLCLRRPGSPSTSAGPAAGSRPPASTTTPIRRSARPDRGRQEVHAARRRWSPPLVTSWTPASFPPEPCGALTWAGTSSATSRQIVAVARTSAH